MKFEELSARDKVSSNLDILRYLFEFLDIGDQLRLANISLYMQSVFRNYINPHLKLKKVKIKKYSDTIRLKGISNSMDYDLTYEEFEYFLNIFGQQMEELNESHGNAFTIPLPLENLTCIKYNYLLITSQQLQLLLEMCPQLEMIFLHGCCNRKHDILRLGTDIDVNFLLALSNLKSFSLKTGLDYKIKCGNVEDLMRRAKLPLTTSSRIESLDIYLPTLATRFLSVFLQLKTLTITVFYTIKNEEIIALADACKQLKELSFHFTSFENIEKFSHLTNLTNFLFYNCQGLTYDNLKDILTQIQLETFTSIATKYDGLFHYYFLAPTIKSVYIDAIKPFDFKTEMEFYRSYKESAL